MTDLLQRAIAAVARSRELRATLAPNVDRRSTRERMLEAEAHIARLERAMVSRAVIEQAKGMLMARHHCDADRAFELLTQASQRSNRKVTEIAAAMVTGI